MKPARSAFDPIQFIKSATAARQKANASLAQTATREELQEREIKRLAKILVQWQHAELAKRAQERSSAA